MMPEANGWQVFSVCLLFLLACCGAAKAIRAWHDRRKAPPPPVLQQHVELMRRSVAEARLKAVEFRLAAEHSQALADMYKARVASLAEELSALPKVTFHELMDGETYCPAPGTKTVRVDLGAGGSGGLGCSDKVPQ